MADQISVEESGFEEPTIKFEEPEVREAGDMSKVTKGFFGSFSP